MVTATKKLKRKKKNKKLLKEKLIKKIKEQLITEWIRERLQSRYVIPSAEPSQPKIVKALRLRCVQDYYDITNRDFWNLRSTDVKHLM